VVDDVARPGEPRGLRNLPLGPRRDARLGGELPQMEAAAASRRPSHDALPTNAEAVTRHYRLSDPRRAAATITAYLAAQGAGVPLSPGISAGQPVFPERLRALAASVERGRALWARRCDACHRAGDVARTLIAYPRVVSGHVESLEEFVEHHRAEALLTWNSRATTDLIAYLTEERRR
jgi:hypothetical protein